MKSNIIISFTALFLLLINNTTQAQKTKFSNKTLLTEIITSNGVETNLDDVFESLDFGNIFILVYNSNKTDFIENLPKIIELQKANPNFKYLYIATDTDKENWQSLVKSYELIGMKVILRKPVDFSTNEELEIDVNCKIIILNKKNEIAFNKDVQTSFTEIDTFMKGLKYFK
jgi:hypothetical protein